MAQLYEPTAFFDRFDALWLHGPVDVDPGWRRYAATHRLALVRRQAWSWMQVLLLSASILLRLPDRGLRRIYVQRFLAALRKRPDAGLMRMYALRCAIHFHFHQLVHQLQARDRPLINTY